jgi:hypothetical protein
MASIKGDPVKGLFLLLPLLLAGRANPAEKPRFKADFAFCPKTVAFP